jgi:hypothetical protein
MKKLSILLLVGFFCASTAEIYTQSCTNTYKRRDKLTSRSMVARKMYSSYIASLILSSCVGATTGASLRYIEKQVNIEPSPIALLLTLLGWALESELRNDIIQALQKDLDMQDVMYKRGLMFKGAWISSWLAYLSA